MVVSKATTVSAYLSEMTPDRRAVVERLLRSARRHLKGYREVIRYGMIYFESESGEGLGIANQRAFVAVYLGERRAATHRQELTGQDLGKSCWRLATPDRIDWDLVDRVLA